MPEYQSFNDTFNGVPMSGPIHHQEDGERALWPTPSNASPQSRVEVGRGGAEVTIRNGHMIVSRDSDQTNTFETATGFAREGDLLSTARSPSGSPVIGRAVQPTDLIEYGGQRFTVALAESFGLIKRDVAGNWTPTAEGNAGATMPEAKKAETRLADGGTAEAAGAEGFRADDATEATMTELVETVSTGTQMAMINAYMAEGKVNANLLARAASQTGDAPEDMTAKVESAVSGMERAVETRLATLGVHDADIFSEWLWSNSDRLGRAREATLTLMTANSTAGIDQLAGEFVESLDQHDQAAVTEALEDAGIAFRKDGGRVILILPNGTQVSYGVAVKQGLIKVSRA
jgi:hypothetical protein